MASLAAVAAADAAAIAVDDGRRAMVATMVVPAGSPAELVAVTPHRKVSHTGDAGIEASSVTRLRTSCTAVAPPPSEPTSRPPADAAAAAYALSSYAPVLSGSVHDRRAAARVDGNAREEERCRLKRRAHLDGNAR